LKNKWKWSDIGTATYILGLKLERHRPSKTISLSQEGYIQRVLDQDSHHTTLLCHDEEARRYHQGGQAEEDTPSTDSWVLDV
jgi:hypothetical protein